MSLYEHLHLALQAIRANWLRSLLTALGVIIGVASLVALTAISAGARQSVAAQLQRLGPNIILLDGEFVPLPSGEQSATDRTLTPGDLAAVSRRPGVIAVAPRQTVEGMTISAGRVATSPFLTGLTPLYERIHNYAPAAGRLLNGSDNRLGREVMVLGPHPASVLFPNTSPIGRSVRVLDREFTVVGVYASKGSLGSETLDNSAFIPLIVAIYYSGELVWRDRDQRIHEIVDACPAPNWTMLLPKVLAVGGVLFASLVVGVLTGMLFQLSHGYWQLEPAHYLLWSLLPQTILAWQMAVLAVFVQSLVPHKAVGWAVMLLYIVASVTLTNLGFEHGLYRYAAVGRVPLSDMNGMGRFWIARAWFEVYWSAFAVMLVVVAQLLWRRGADAGDLGALGGGGLETRHPGARALCRSAHRHHPGDFVLGAEQRHGAGRERIRAGDACVVRHHHGHGPGPHLR